jgi:acyl-CoA synthetase (AMP-forming)/AMP-acid ligase II
MPDGGGSISYGDMVANADRAAQLFQQLGLNQGDTIAIHLENHLRYPEICWAAKNSGITYACVSSLSSADDAGYIVDNSDAKLLITSAALADVAIQVVRSRKHLLCLMLDGAASPFGRYEDLLERAPATPLHNRWRGPSMLYSSGTTGRPKGVRTPLMEEPPETPPRRLAMLVRRYGLAADTVLINPGPLYHAAPGRFMMSVHRTGGTVIGFRKFDAEATLRAIQDFRATHGVFVPTMLIRMLQLPEDVRDRYNHASLRCAIHLAAPCPISIKERMIQWWGPIIYELYGGTEAVGYTLISSDEWLAHKGSVGRADLGCNIRILDDAGNELPPFEPGVIYMFNGNRFEYHKDPEKTRTVFTTDGWATLGDIGYLDREGYLYLTDRQAHMIISGGVNIYPQEAENVLAAHPDVADVAVIGVPHPEFGEEVKAVVQLLQDPDDPQSLEEELIAHCRFTLSAIKCPRSVDFVKQLPRNEAGKLLKRELRKLYWGESASPTRPSPNPADR